MCLPMYVFMALWWDYNITHIDDIQTAQPTSADLPMFDSIPPMSMQVREAVRAAEVPPDVCIIHLSFHNVCTHISLPSVVGGYLQTNQCQVRKHHPAYVPLFLIDHLIDGYQHSLM